MTTRINLRILAAASTLAAVASLAVVAGATHSWGGFHWARTSNPFTLSVGDNVSGAWDASLALSASDWSLSNVLNLSVVPGGSNARWGKKTPKNCVPTAGRIEACNAKYGNNGWLGLASVWASGTHITQATAKMNDTYFNTPTYNTPAWRNMVMCQELAHGFGLDHQDEVFDNPNLGSCMDYTGDPSTNQNPNQHDYDMLETIYEHLDATTTISAGLPRGAAKVDVSAPSEWGREIRSSRDRRASLFERDFGAGNKVFTYVIWAL